MSAYLLNLFDDENQNSLVESISVFTMNVMPLILNGTAGQCLLFQDSGNYRNISFCSSDSAVIGQIQQVYKDILLCRRGGNLDKLEPTVIKNVVKSACNFYLKRRWN